MSYSFSIRAANKAAAKALIAARMAEVAKGQACHKRDEAQAVATAGAYIDMLDDDDSKDVVVHVNGSLSGRWVDGDITIVTGANLSLGACTAERAKAE